MSKKKYCLIQTDMPPWISNGAPLREQGATGKLGPDSMCIYRQAETRVEPWNRVQSRFNANSWTLAQKPCVRLRQVDPIGGQYWWRKNTTILHGKHNFQTGFMFWYCMLWLGMTSILCRKIANVHNIDVYIKFPRFVDLSSCIK